ncbi:MAG TPA: tetratricopeptide repeat protein [Terracidiphilus sp.]|nr:tetratricopeptide repeat protein [Terracidiphilus sp.]
MAGSTAVRRPAAYNQPVVQIFFPLRHFLSRLVAARAFFALLLPLFFPVVTLACAQDVQESSSAASDHGRILLVLPFDNRTGQPSLEWIREAAANLLSNRFASAGFAPMTRADRMYALDHLGLPQSFQPSRASSLKLAQTLDADSIVVGSYSTDGTQIVAEAQVVDVPHLRISAPVSSRGEMRDMIAVFDSLAWKLTRQLDPSFNGAEETFIAEGKSLRLDAYEQYIRGITEPDHAERQRHLEQAVKLSPDFSPAWMALGREDYQGQQYDEAARAFAKVDRDGPDGLEAGFYRGLSLLFSGDYSHAEQVFAQVARILPLGEVLNNQGVAVSRQGHDATALFVQAASADPNAADYHFNLAVSLQRHGKTDAALNELAQCLKLRPSDSEAQALQAAWKSPAVVPASTGTDSAGAPDPLERIVRTFDAAAFRQAAVMVDEMNANRLAALSPSERALKLSMQARGYLDRGLLLEAERLYQSALAADGQAAQAHVGLALIRERTGNSVEARKEAHAALELTPSADAYLVLCRLDMAENHLSEARDDAGNALKLDPKSQAAQELLRQVQARTGESK